MGADSVSTVFGDRMIENLYVDAMVLADDARAYFDVDGRAGADRLDPATRVGMAVESMRCTTRLMHVLSWLLTRRAVAAGELSSAEALSPSRRLGDVPAPDPVLLAALPFAARAIVMATVELHARVANVEAAFLSPALIPGPAREIQRSLAVALDVAA